MSKSRAPIPGPPEIKIAASPLVTTTFADATAVAKHADGTVWIRFCNRQILDDHWVEEARIVVTLEQARKIVRALQTEIDKDMQVAPADSGHPR
jgi:hypothetical protein